MGFNLATIEFSYSFSVSIKNIDPTQFDISKLLIINANIYHFDI